MSPEADLSLRIEHELFIRSFFDVRPPDRMVRQLAASMKDVFFPKGSTIYEKGMPSGNVFFVISGKVTMESEGTEPWDLGENALVGVIDAGQGRPYSRTARASTDVSALSISFREYLDLMEDNFEFTKATMDFNARSVDQRALGLSPEQVFPSYETSEPIFAVEKHPLELMERLMVLRRSDLFRKGPVQPLVSLAKYTESEQWQPGQVLFQEGDPSPDLRMVVAGRIDIQMERPKISASFGPGTTLRQTLGHDKQVYTARAGTYALTLRVNKEDFFDVMEDHFSLVGSIFRYLGLENERIRTLLAERARLQTADLARS